MNKDNVNSTVKITSGANNVSSEPTTTTKTSMTKDGKMVVEVTTVFEVNDPDKVFGMEGEGVTMSLDTQN